MLRSQVLLASAARTASGNSIDFTNEDIDSNGWGQFVVDITAISGTTPTLTVIIDAFDPASGKYIPLLTSAALNAVGTTVLSVGPHMAAVANVKAQDYLSRTYRIRFTIAGTTPSVTFSVGATIC